MPRSPHHARSTSLAHRHPFTSPPLIHGSSSLRHEVSLEILGTETPIKGVRSNFNRCLNATLTTSARRKRSKDTWGLFRRQTLLLHWMQSLQPDLACKYEAVGPTWLEETAFRRDWDAIVDCFSELEQRRASWTVCDVPQLPKCWKLFMPAYGYRYEAYIEANGIPTPEEAAYDLGVFDEKRSLMNLCQWYWHSEWAAFDEGPSEPIEESFEIVTPDLPRTTKVDDRRIQFGKPITSSRALLYRSVHAIYP